MDTVVPGSWSATSRPTGRTLPSPITSIRAKLDQQSEELRAIELRLASLATRGLVSAFDLAELNLSLASLIGRAWLAQRRVDLAEPEEGTLDKGA